MTIFNAKGAKTPRFQWVYRCADEILILSSAIDGFPFSAKELVKEQADISFCTFEKAKKKYALDVSYLGSDSAVLVEMQGAHIIFFNQVQPLPRIRFSILHEFAHYILRHKLNLEREDPLYQVQEVEANCFAAQLLMPEQLLRECLHRGVYLSESFITATFGVSAEAANKRRSTLGHERCDWYFKTGSEYNDLVLIKYADFLERIAPPLQHYPYSFEDDYERDCERYSWLDSRSRWD